MTPWDSFIATIIADLEKLDAAAILAGVGVCEVFVRRAKKNKGSHSAWLVPLIVGSLFGAAAFIGSAQVGPLQTYIAGIVASVGLYVGWIGFVYVFVRPAKYAGDWIKRKAQGGANAQ